MFLGFEALGFYAISEGPEDRVALSGSSEMILDWEFVIYAATHEIITRLADTPSNQAFKGTLQQAFRVDRSIISSDTIGEAVTISLGELTLTNYEGDYDFLSGALTPLGQKFVIRCGDRRRPYSEWHLVLSGYMTSLTPTRDGVTFELRDAGFLLDVPASPNLYGGTGGTDGDTDLTGKNKPRVFGWVLEWSAPLVIATSRAFQLNDGPISTVNACRILGVEQTFAADYSTVALMNAASLSIGQYATCLAAGWGRVAVANDSEVNNVTWDLAGDATGTFVETAADIVQRLLGATTMTLPDDLSTTSFTALNALQPAPLGYGIAVGDNQSVTTAVGAILASIGGWGGARRSGKFEVKRFEVPSGIPVGSYNKQNLSDLQLVALPSALSPPPWRVKVGYQRVWTTGQTNLAGSVSESYVSFLQADVRLTTSEDVDIKNDFPPGFDLIKDQTYFRDEADAQAESDRQLALWGTARALYSLPLNERLYIHDPGDVITLQWDGRFSLDDGILATVVEETADNSNGVTLTVFA